MRDLLLLLQNELGHCCPWLSPSCNSFQTLWALQEEKRTCSFEKWGHVILFADTSRSWAALFISCYFVVELFSLQLCTYKLRKQNNHLSSKYKLWKLTWWLQSSAFHFYERVVVFGNVTLFQKFPHLLVRLVLKRRNSVHFILLLYYFHFSFRFMHNW